MQSLLRVMLDDMAKADPLFQATPFWQACSREIIDELERHGFDRFRSLPSLKANVITNYVSDARRQFGARTASLTRLPLRGMSHVRRLHASLTGGEQAEREHLIFRAADLPVAPDLSRFSESDACAPDEQFTFDGKRYGGSSLLYLRGLAFLKKSVRADLPLRAVLEIGGGSGTLGEIVGKCTDAVYVNIDIPPVAAVSTHYLKAVFGAEAVLDYAQSREMDVIDLAQLKQRFVVLCPWQLPKLRGAFDLFVNFVSFQEMEPQVVANYVKWVLPLVRSHVLLRNSVHGKRGSAEAVTMAFLLKQFAGFDVAARDAAIFGQVAGDFVSEVVHLVRRPPDRTTFGGTA